MFRVCRTPPLKVVGVVRMPLRPTLLRLNDSTTVSKSALVLGDTSLGMENTHIHVNIKDMKVKEFLVT